jgi:hypothetical protein
MTSIQLNPTAWAVGLATIAADLSPDPDQTLVPRDLVWNYQKTELPRLRRDAAAAMVPENGQKNRVYNVPTFGFGLARISAGLVRIRHVFWTSQYLQGLESGSSPTSGTVFPQVRGLLTSGVWTKLDF